MLQVTDRKFHNCESREDYLKLPGISFSQLKNKTFVETEGMKIGTLVHKYLLKPKEYNYEQHEIVIPVANALINKIGWTILNNALCEVPVTAKFTFQGKVFEWKGIPDIPILDTIVIDIKVIKGKLHNYLKLFNYPNQLRGYMKGFNAPIGLIVSGNRTKKPVEVETHIVHPDDAWWEGVVLDKGVLIT